MYNYYVHKNADSDGPVINIDSKIIEISVKDDESVLLEGVSAFDSKDGDVSGSIGIESISDFDEKMERVVHYVAFDSNNNVSKATRKLKYSDYKPIVFEIEEPFRFPSNLGNTDVLGIVHAKDCLDGDVSNQISFSDNSSIYTSIPSDYKISLIVKNSAGDIEELPATVTIYDPAVENECPKIVLSNYLIYSTQGKEINPLDYIQGIIFNRKEYLITDNRGTFDVDTSKMTNEERAAFNKEEPTVSKDKFRISDEFDYNTPGVYEIKYSIDSPEGNRGSVNLIVVVTGEMQ